MALWEGTTSLGPLPLPAGTPLWRQARLRVAPDGLPRPPRHLSQAQWLRPPRATRMKHPVEPPARGSQGTPPKVAGMAMATPGILFGKGHLPWTQVKFFVHFHPDGNTPLQQIVCRQHHCFCSEGSWPRHWERPIRPKFVTCHCGHGEDSGLPHASNRGDSPWLEHPLPCPIPPPGCRGLPGRPHGASEAPWQAAPAQDYTVARQGDHDSWFGDITPTAARRRRRS